MSLVYNGKTVTDIIYNGHPVKTLVYNGTTVFTGSTPIFDSWSDFSTYLGCAITQKETNTIYSRIVIRENSGVATNKASSSPYARYVGNYDINIGGSQLNYSSTYPYGSVFFYSFTKGSDASKTIIYPVASSAISNFYTKYSTQDQAQLAAQRVMKDTTYSFHVAIAQNVPNKFYIGDQLYISTHKDYDFSSSATPFELDAYNIKEAINQTGLSCLQGTFGSPVVAYRTTTFSKS